MGWILYALRIATCRWVISRSSFGTSYGVPGSLVMTVHDDRAYDKDHITTEPGWELGRHYGSEPLAGQYHWEVWDGHGPISASILFRPRSSSCHTQTSLSDFFLTLPSPSSVHLGVGVRDWLFPVFRFACHAIFRINSFKYIWNSGSFETGPAVDRFWLAHPWHWRRSIGERHGTQAIKKDRHHLESVRICRGAGPVCKSESAAVHETKQPNSMCYFRTSLQCTISFNWASPVTCLRTYGPGDSDLISYVPFE